MRLIAICFFLFMVTTCSAGVFDVVKSLPVRERIVKTQDIYDTQVKRGDSVFAIASIKQLITIAYALDDKALQCLSISLLADQYARIRGANDLSAQLHREAIGLAEKYRLPLLKGISNYRMGRYYYSFKSYPLAFEYLLRADNYFHDIGYKAVPDMDEILFFIGSIYYESGSYDKSKSFLQSIQELKKVNSYIQKQSLNTLALISKQQNDTTRALAYFKKIVAIAVAQHDSTWIGISYSNIGSLYFSGEQYNKAYSFLQEGTTLSLAHKQWSDAYTNLLLMARIDVMRNKTGSAQNKIEDAIALQKVHFTMPGRKSLYETQALYYEKINQQAKALAMQHKLLLVKDSMAINNDQQAYKKIQLRIETEKHLSDIDKLEAKANASALERNAVIIVLILLVIVLLLVYSRYRLKAASHSAILLQKQNLLQAEKLRAEEKLKFASQLLQNFTENTRQKNELIEQFAAELEQLKGSLPGHPVYEERLNNFEQLVQSTILTDGQWNDFRILFDKVHRGFFVRLEEKFPDLSLNDARLLSLIRLRLSNLEMANMIGMDVEAVEQLMQLVLVKISPPNNAIAIQELVQAI